MLNQDSIQIKTKMNQEKLKILFVCTANILRSKTAEVIYKDDERFEVQSVGTSTMEDVGTPISYEKLNWADWIVVMDVNHKQHIQFKFPEIYANKKLICLNIPDDFEFMQKELITLIKIRFEKIIQTEIHPL